MRPLDFAQHRHSCLYYALEGKISVGVKSDMLLQKTVQTCEEPSSELGGPAYFESDFGPSVQDMALGSDVSSTQ